jgi:prepilin-type N-terminal cleavage/methylation domain-containing protein
VERDDRGFTLVELIIVMAVAGVLIALAARLVISIAQGANAATVTAGRVDTVRLAVDSVERQVRSGDVLFLEPASSTCAVFGSGSNCLRVATEVDGVTTCVQFQLVPGTAADGTYDLRARTYRPDWASTGIAGGWRQVAKGLAAPTSQLPPFSLTQQSGAAAQALIVQFAAPETSPVGAPIKLTATFVPRNALYGSSTTCSGGAPA